MPRFLKLFKSDFQSNCFTLQWAMQREILEISAAEGAACTEATRCSINSSDPSKLWIASTMTLAHQSFACFRTSTSAAITSLCAGEDLFNLMFFKSQRVKQLANLDFSCVDIYKPKQSSIIANFCRILSQSLSCYNGPCNVQFLRSPQPEFSFFKVSLQVVMYKDTPNAEVDEDGTLNPKP